METAEFFEANPNPLGALALVGAPDVIEGRVIDEFIEDIYRSRANDLSREVPILLEDLPLPER